MSGLRVELEIDAPTGCPVVETARTAAATASSVTWSDAGERTIEQFEIDDGRAPAGSGSAVASEAPSSSATGAPDERGEPLPEGVRPVFEHDRGAVYEFERDDGPCACERVEAAGVPVSDVRAEDGSLRLTLHLEEGRDLGALLAELRATAEDASIRSVTRSTPDGGGPGDLIPVDRGRLTERQREVLETAYAMGYYEYPRGANASEVADALGICPSTLAEHLAAAQSKLLGDVLGDRE